MNKAKEISALWSQIKPQIGELVNLCHEIEDHAEVTADAYQRGYEAGYKDGYNEPGKNQQEVYQRGLNDAWEVARKICLNDCDGGLTVMEIAKIFDVSHYRDTLKNYSASVAMEKIRQYEQEKEESEEQEQSFTVEEVMRQYLDNFCTHNRCAECPLYTPDFTCGRGYHFLTHSCISDEEVRRAYVEVLAKMREN